MNDNRMTAGETGSVVQTVVIGLSGHAGVLVDAMGRPGERVIELLSRDGRMTTIVQRPDGALVVGTDGLRDAAHAVRVSADGVAEPVPIGQI
ncbi:hypothetical protein [Williamsia phyllosphaerae]|uniref:Uncharacterized protein n=1 Tax=Williamsia phyllosphaerae TaxID=885042 RepID=A0ABQ1UCL2_9NOCA|nr:hypothetical protein [Williamsia phyllosphaerae]GGF15938.1 hypothetical protein GCM10007298_09980 [Williamsia phyllosphaerae]